MDPPNNPKAPKGKQAWLIAASALGAIIILVGMRSTRPQRVFAISSIPGRAIGIDRGRWLYIDENEGMALKSVPLRGGPASTLVPSFSRKGRLENVVRNGEGFLITVADPPTLATQNAVRLYDVSLDGSKPREILPNLANLRRITSGDACFSLSRPPGSMIMGPEGGPPPPPSKPPPDVEWTVTPVSGGPTRLIDRLSAQCEQRAIGSGAVALSWRDNVAILHFVSPPDFKEVHVSPVNIRLLTALAEWKGRVYWFQPVASIKEYELGGNLGAWELVSVATDGSDRRIEMSSSGNMPFPIGAYRGQFYFGVPRDNAFDLSTLSDETRIKLKKVATLPQEAQGGSFDEGYYYYSATEHPDNWFDWSSTGLTLKKETVLYRIALPN